MKILIADDDPVHIQLVSAQLRAEGFQVLVARDSMQALMLTLRGKPNAVLLDVNMPGGTGLQTLRQLKASPDTKPIPVIVVSGSDDPELIKKLTQLGAEDFLRKPFAADDLLRILARVTGKPLQHPLKSHYRIVRSQDGEETNREP
jgi:CheY-like chemotaxis protein